jgi:hypothetical protein
MDRRFRLALGAVMLTVLLFRLAADGLRQGQQALADSSPADSSRPVPARTPAATAAPERLAKKSPGWTLDDALAQLQLHPRDPYLQYVVLQLARRAGRLEEVGGQVEQLVFGEERQQRADRNNSVDLFSLFSGALAVQESLQLDTMLGGRSHSSVSALPSARTETHWKKVSETVITKDGKKKAVYKNVPYTVAVVEPDAVAATPALPAAAASPPPTGRIEGGGPLGPGVLAGAAATSPPTGRTEETAPVPPVVVPLPGPAPTASPPALTAGSDEEQAARDKRRKEVVAVSTLAGPTVKSHPWKKMLAGRTPDVSDFARSVPADFYFAEFRSIAKLLDVLDHTDLWATQLFHQAVQEARTHQVGERLTEQLALEKGDLLRPFYDLVVQGVAVTGSDLYLREGSDATLLFRFFPVAAFEKRMDGLLARVQKTRPDARRTTGEYLGVAYVHVGTPDRAVNVYSAYPAEGLHVRSNSEASFRRVLEAVRGKDATGKPVPRLGDTAEFKYIRTLMPAGASEEDGFIYLSDPFIRRLVGPGVKLTERRRLLCYNHLRMIGHAALLYRTEHGKAPASLEALHKAGCCPGEFNEELTCPCGGAYSLSADGTAGVCSHHGHANFLTPCCEIPLAEVTGEEADEYKAFRDEYDRYWRNYFDPIALRVRITPQQYRLETIVLPLIDNSIYTTLAAALGGKPEPLDALPVPRKNIFSLAFRFNKEALVKLIDKPWREERDAQLLPALALLAGSPAAGFPGHVSWGALQEYSARPDPEYLNLPDLLAGMGVPRKDADKMTTARAVEFLSRGLGNQVGVHVCDADPMIDLNLPALFGMVLGAWNGGVQGDQLAEGALDLLEVFAAVGAVAPGYLSVPVRDARVVDEFLDALDPVLAVLARQPLGDVGIRIEQDFYKFSLKSRDLCRSYGIRIGPVKVRVFYARIGDSLYVTGKPYILEDIVAAATTESNGGGPKGHAMVRLRPRHWDRVLVDFRLAWAENNRQACLNNLGPLTGVGRAWGAAHPAGRGGSWDDRSRAACRCADQLYGVHFFCPEGGRYVFSRGGKTMACSVHGSARDPRQPDAPAEDGPWSKLMRGFDGMTATLSFLEDGLRGVVTIERK